MSHYISIWKTKKININQYGSSFFTRIMKKPNPQQIRKFLNINDFLSIFVHCYHITKSMLSFTNRRIGANFLQLTIVNRQGEKIPVPFQEGQRLFQAVVPTPAKELQGNCEGNMTCGKCHCILDEDTYEENQPEDIELDVLERQPNCTPTSRLACNLKLTKGFDGKVIQMAK